MTRIVVSTIDVRYVEEERVFDPARVTDLCLIQAEDDLGFLAAAATLRNGHVVVFPAGNMRFGSTGGGRLALESFAVWARTHLPVTARLLTGPKEVIRPMLTEHAVFSPEELREHQHDEFADTFLS